MIIINEKVMQNKNLFLRNPSTAPFDKGGSRKFDGFTLLELIIASVITATLFTSALVTVSSIYMTQKRVRIAQDFYAESRILVERVSQLMRNNTLDYDQYFVAYGPGVGRCPSFNLRQYDHLNPASPDLVAPANDQTFRERVGYPNIFYWDTALVPDGETDRQLGGVDRSGNVDECTEAFDLQYDYNGDGAVGRDIDHLYLINGARTVRTIVRQDTTEIDHDGDSQTSAVARNQLQMRREMTIDLDGDLRGDVWAVPIWDGDKCIITDSGGLPFSVLGDSTSQAFCQLGHDFVDLAPPTVSVDGLTFAPGPSRDPYLAFRVDEAQTHPHVFMSIEVSFRNFRGYGFKQTSRPQTVLQTGVSSRVYGESR